MVAGALTTGRVAILGILIVAVAAAAWWAWSIWKSERDARLNEERRRRGF